MADACYIRSKNKCALEIVMLCALNLNAAARGGEACHNSWEEAMWDTYLATLEVLWKESKTLNKYPLVLFNGSKNLSLNILLLLGGYFAIDDVLRRDHADGMRVHKKVDVHISVFSAASSIYSQP
jgi:hypothetical protein